MALFNSVLASMYQPLTDADCRESLQILDFSMRCDRDGGGSTSGNAWLIEIEVPNPGLAMLAAGAPEFIAFIQGPDSGVAKISNSTVLARGRIIPASGNLGGLTVRLNIVCAPVNLQGILLAFAQAHQGEPEFDWLFGDISWTNPTSVLEGRSATFNIDPVTHEISFNDVIDGDSTVAIGSDYDMNSLDVKRLAPPVATARISVAAEWTQRAVGIVDIAGILNTRGITTMNPGHLESAGRNIPGSLLRFDLGQGWKSDLALAKMDVFGSAPLATGREFTFVWQQFTPSEVTLDPSGHGIASVSTAMPVLTTQVVDEIAQMSVYSYEWIYNKFYFDYEQQRREILTILVSYPLQGGVPTLAEHNLGELRLSDLYQMWMTNPNPPPAPDAWGNYIFPYEPYITVKAWNYDTVYNAGDICELGQIYYRANKTTSGYFWKMMQNVNWVEGAYNFPGMGHPDWDIVPSTAAITHPAQPNFFDTARGFMGVEHAILRARAFLRRRSQCLQVGFERPWDDADSIGMRNRVSADILSVASGGSCTTQPITGKVTSLERHWNENGRTVKITLGVEVGTGASTAPAPASPVAYMDPSYTSTAYVAQGAGGSAAFSDVEYTFDTQPVVQPVNAASLSNPQYAVLAIDTENQYDFQFQQAMIYASKGIDPRQAAQDYPTSMTVTMRPLSQMGVIQRNLDVAANVAVSPRGIDLTTPGGAP